MTTPNAAYCNLRDEFVSRCACVNPDLQILKSVFKEHINSTRRLENIRNISELIRLLEKRNALNVEDYSCLKTIAQMLRREDLLLLINGEYVVQQSVPVQQQQVPVLPLGPNFTNERIHTLIVEKIGGKWKELARSLSIGEGRIDELEERYRSDPSERVRKILQYHEHNTPPKQVWYKLMDALCESRRTDLKNEVQRILSGT